jgi:hypothetical protein
MNGFKGSCGRESSNVRRSARCENLVPEKPTAKTRVGRESPRWKKSKCDEMNKGNYIE